MLSDTPSEISSGEWLATSRSPKLLDEATIRGLLDTLQGKLFKNRSGAKTTLVVHGGIVSVLLHKSRIATTDIDYIGRTVYEEIADVTEGAYAAETDLKAPKRDWKKFFARLHGRGTLGPDEMNLLIRVCVEEMTLEYNADFRNSAKLKLDWLNCAADVALPWSLDENNHMYDPLVHSTINNPLARTVFDSPGLKLVCLPWTWQLALKLQRFTPNDQADIVAILQYEALITGADDSLALEDIERILRKECAVMDYGHFPDLVLMEWRMRLYDCIQRVRFGLDRARAAENMTYVAV